MRAAVVVAGRLEIQERPDPVPRDGEIVIRVRAAGINGADVLQRLGRYPPPPGAPPDIPGLECAGETKAGERVMALLPGGGHAELVAVHESHVLPVPDDVDWPQAGGFVEVFATA
ncbi:MAG: alcohol dehydrogenase catalytic domain-containing protein, partial [Gaiellaceae bacterium]